MALIDNLISYFKFDEASGTTATDAHASNNGTLSGANIAVNQTGIINTGYEVDTNDGSSVSIPIDPISSYSDFSISLWMKTTDAGGLNMMCGNKMSGSTGPVVTSSTTGFDDGNWHNVIGIRSGTTIKLFVDGVYEGTATGAFTGWSLWSNRNGNGEIEFYTQTSTAGTSTLQIFRWNSTVSFSFVGNIDEVGLWDKQLDYGGVSVGQTATGEVADLYNSGAGLPYPFSAGPTVTPTALSLTSTINAPAINTTGNITVTPTTLALTSTLIDPTISITIPAFDVDPVVGKNTFYVKNESGIWILFDQDESFTVKKRQNQLSEFEVKLFDIDSDDKLFFKEKADVLFFSGLKMILKGRIQTIDYGSSYEVVARGFGSGEAKLMDNDFIKDGDNRIQYTNESAKTIGLDINTDLSSNPILTTASSGLWETDYGNLSMRFEHSKRLKSIASLSEAIDYEWWVSQTSSDDYLTDYINIDSLRGSTSSVKTYDITTNATATNQERDLNNLANSVTVLGYGDGVNQLSTKTFAASTQNSILNTNISLTDSSIELLDASDFDATGTTRIAEEQLTYAGISSNTLTGCTRGTNSTTARPHRKSCYIEQNFAETSSQTGSSIKTYGIMDDTFIDRTLLDLETAEIIGSKRLIERKDPIERITVIPDEPFDDVAELEIGDVITINDSESGISGEQRIVGITYKNNFGFLSLEVEASNRSLEFVEQMNKQREQEQNLGKYMQGSTNIYAINEAENCDDENYLDLRFFVPNEAIAINKVLLNFKLKDYRSYSKTTLNSKNTAGSPTSPKKVWNNNNTIDSGSSTVTLSTVVQDSPDIEVENYEDSGSAYGYGLSSTTTDFRLAQKRTIENKIISKIAFNCRKIGSPTGNITYAIRRVSDDSIINSLTLSASGAPTAVGGELYEGTFDTPVLINEDVYLTAEYNGGDGSNYMSFSIDTNISPEPPGSAWRYDGTWHEAPTADMLMKITFGAFNGCIATAQIYNASGSTDTFKYKIRNDTTSTDLYDNSTGFSASNQSFLIDANNVFDTSEVSAGDTMQLIIYEGVLGTANAETGLGYAELILVSSPQHSHGQNYGIDKQELSSPSVDVYTGEDDGAMTLKDTYTTDQTEIDITDEVAAVGAGKWVNVQFRPNKNMRIEADAYVQIFIESK